LLPKFNHFFTLFFFWNPFCIKSINCSLEVAIDEEELVKFLANEDNQEDLIILEQKVKGKKLAAI
jgi:hypothetical protein